MNDTVWGFRIFLWKEIRFGFEYFCEEKALFYFFIEENNGRKIFGSAKYIFYAGVAFIIFLHIIRLVHKQLCYVPESLFLIYLG